MTTQFSHSKQVIPKQYMKPKVFLAAKQKIMFEGLQSEDKTFQEHSITKKYFGHKVTFINNPKQLLRSSPSYKYINCAVLNENVKMKTIQYEVSIQSLNGLLLLSKKLLVMEKDLLKFVLRTKPSMKLENHSQLKS